MRANQALVLFSGGQDSTTCLFWALKKFSHVMAIGFDYGQRHSTELNAAESIARSAGVKYLVLKVDTLSGVSENALTRHNLVIGTQGPEGQPPNTLVEGRNLLFLTYAAIHAKQNLIHNLVIGTGQADYSGYPDCRNSFMVSANRTLNLAFDFRFKIHTPLMWKTKAQVWETAQELGIFDIVRNETVTCYQGIKGDGCGVCPSCLLRNRGLTEYFLYNNPK